VVVVSLTVVNATAENLVQPALMHKGIFRRPSSSCQSSAPHY
jgi:hypothetical protein